MCSEKMLTMCQKNVNIAFKKILIMHLKNVKYVLKNVDHVYEKYTIHVKIFDHVFKIC